MKKSSCPLTSLKLSSPHMRSWVTRQHPGSWDSKSNEGCMVGEMALRSCLIQYFPKRFTHSWAQMPPKTGRTVKSTKSWSSPCHFSGYGTMGQPGIQNFSLFLWNMQNTCLTYSHKTTRLHGCTWHSACHRVGHRQILAGFIPEAPRKDERESGSPSEIWIRIQKHLKSNGITRRRHSLAGGPMEA